MQMLCDSLRTHPRFKSFLTPQTITLLIELTPIHDIGKVGIPDSILLKNGPLTPGEYSTMKQHAEHGRRILDRARLSSGLLDSQVFQIARAMVSGHHEHWDGSGYPDGLRGDEIPIPARMLAVADVFDALVSRRVYKDAIDPIAATEIIRNGRATKFDPDIVDALLAHQADWQKIALQWHDRTTPPQTKAASAGA
jgi:HD-GYP domain-containing protein (c-di-GMP phosphodiesterase class II)